MQAGRCYAFAVFRTGQTVDNAVRLFVIYPCTVIDVRIGRVISLYEGEGSHYFLFFIKAYIAVPVFNILFDNLYGRVAAGPLFGVPVLAHDALSLFKDIHKDGKFCDFGFSDFYHNL